MHEMVGQMLTHLHFESKLAESRRQPEWPGRTTVVSKTHVGSHVEPDSHQGLTACILSLCQGQSHLAYFQGRCG